MDELADEHKIKVLQQLSGTIASRASLANELGKQYGTDRDIYEALGYNKQPLYATFLSRYYRQDMAKAIIDRPVRQTWLGPLDIIEADDDKETALEKEWKKLAKEMELKSKFVRLDKLTGIGRYGILLMGTDDLTELSKFAEPVKSGKRTIKYLKPLGEGSAQIKKYDVEPKSERFGQPLLYEIAIGDESTNQTSTTLTSQTLVVHYTRIIHVVDDLLESEVLGESRLLVVLNRLFDLEKVVGGSAEMYWRGARPGYQGKVDPAFQMTEKTKEGLQDQIKEYENNLRRILINEGVDLTALEQQVADPTGQVNVIISMISAVTGIPKRILIGSERGELSSTQDKKEWDTYVTARRTEYAETKIVRPFVEWCITYGVLPKPKENYSVRWEDLFATSEKEKVEIGKFRSEALKAYTQNPMAEVVIPPDAFLEFFLGLTEDQVEMIRERQKDPLEVERRMQAGLTDDQIIEENNN